MPAASRPRLVLPHLLAPALHPRWWEGAKAGYRQGFNALKDQDLPKPPGECSPGEKQVWWMGYRSAHGFGFKDMQEGLPFTEPPAQPEHIWPEDEEGA